MKMELNGVRSTRHGSRRTTEGGFTMVEIAFSLAIVAFALVAIMGVLPTGMTVQKDNREDTLINNDGYFWTEAMRSGTRGVYDLTNYVEEITIENARGTSRWTNTWDNNSQITTSEQIIGLLSTPKYQYTNGNVLLTNQVRARVRAINGSAIDMRNPKGNDFVFRYQLDSEITPVFAAPVYTPGANLSEKRMFWTDYGAKSHVQHATLATNLHNVRLTLRWPVFEQGNTWGVGRSRRTVRSLANGRITATPQDEIEQRVMVAGQTNTMIRPNIYQYVSNEELQ